MTWGYIPDPYLLGHIYTSNLGFPSSLIKLDMLASAVKVNSDEYINDIGIMGVTVISRALGNKMLCASLFFRLRNHAFAYGVDLVGCVIKFMIEANYIS